MKTWLASAWNRSVALLVIAVAVYFRTWADLWPLWENKNATYTHGVLIAAIVCWLIWHTRPALAPVPPVADRRPLPLLLLLSLLWLVAVRANVMVVNTMLWPLLAFTILWAGAGWQVARRLAFPLAFLYFAIPFWDYLEPALQAIASNVVGFLIRIAGTQASVDGPYILLPSTTIFIALTCSGAHFLAVSLAMGALAGEMRDDTPRTRLLIMMLAGLLSVAFNSIRILLIVLANLHPTLRHGFETIGHLTFGWWVFALDILVFFLALRLIPVSKLSGTEENSPAISYPPERSATGLGAAIAVAILLPALSWGAQHLDNYAPAPPGPASLAGMTGPLSPDSSWQPHFSGAAWEHRVAYLSSGGRVIELFRTEYHQQSQAHELIFRGEANTRLFDPTLFRVLAAADVQLAREGAAPLAITRAQLQDRSGRTWSALYTYVLDGETVTRPDRMQWLTAMRGLYSRPAAGIFAVATPCVPDCATVNADLQSTAIRAFKAYSVEKAP